MTISDATTVRFCCGGRRGIDRATCTRPPGLTILHLSQRKQIVCPTREMVQSSTAAPRAVRPAGCSFFSDNVIILHHRPKTPGVPVSLFHPA